MCVKPNMEELALSVRCVIRTQNSIVAASLNPVLVAKIEETIRDGRAPPLSLSETELALSTSTHSLSTQAWVSGRDRTAQGTGHSDTEPDISVILTAYRNGISVLPAVGGHFS
eukprot:COSAG02_NODE_1692_length_11293_cov_12.853940_7_plen_113_part_00